VLQRPVESTQFNLFAASDTRPEVDCAIAESGEDAAGSFRIDVAIKGLKLGEHAYPPKVQLRQFEPESDIGKRHLESPDFEGSVPDHLPLRPLPKQLSDELRVARRIDSEKDRERSHNDLHEATTIFSPDDRYTFNDTAYPWSTCGRIETPGGSASGAMVGPRHVLTCSHTIQWNSDGTAGWVKFTPSYFDGSAPFGVAWGTMVYWEGLKVFGPTINSSEGRHDYVCVVLNWNIGAITGWMGSRTYSDSWDGGTYWSHIGYPGDLGGAQRPSYQGGIALDGSFWDLQNHQRIYHKGDVWPGQSGGPFFGWWAGESFPRIVADQSGQSSSENSASGGAHMVDCIIRARNDFP
jgi:V8-like Glu-specific endopeptidase